MQAADLKRDMDLALERLVSMFKRLPENADMSLAAGRLLYAKGDPNLKPYAAGVALRTQPESGPVAVVLGQGRRT